MNDPPRHPYDITITINKDSSPLSGPTEFTAAAKQAASARGVSGIMSAHIADKIICIVTVTATSRATATSLALAVVSDALSHRAG